MSWLLMYLYIFFPFLIYSFRALKPVWLCGWRSIRNWHSTHLSNLPGSEVSHFFLNLNFPPTLWGRCYLHFLQIRKPRLRKSKWQSQHLEPGQSSPYPVSHVANTTCSSFSPHLHHFCKHLNKPHVFIFFPQFHRSVRMLPTLCPNSRQDQNRI